MDGDEVARARLAVADDVGDRVLRGRPARDRVADEGDDRVDALGLGPEPAEVLGRVGREDVAQELEAARVDRRRVAVQRGRATSLSTFSSSSSRSRSRKRWIFVADIGHSSPLMKRITRGSLNEAILPRQCSISSSSVASAPGSSSTNAAGTSSSRSSGMPTTWTRPDRGVQRELGLDLLRRDVLAADLQRLLDAAEEQHAAVLVHHAQVAHRHPAAGQDRLGGLDRVVPVAVERAEAAEVDHAALAGAEHAAVVDVDDPQLHPRLAGAAGVQAHLERVVERDRGHHAALGPAVDRELDRVRDRAAGSARAPRAGRRWRTRASRSGRRAGSPGGRRSPPSPAGRRDRTR